MTSPIGFIGRGLPVEGARVARRIFTDSRAHGGAELGTRARYRALERRLGR